MRTFHDYEVGVPCIDWHHVLMVAPRLSAKEAHAKDPHANTPGSTRQVYGQEWWWWRLNIQLLKEEEAAVDERKNPTIDLLPQKGRL